MIPKYCCYCESEKLKLNFDKTSYYVYCLNCGQFYHLTNKCVGEIKNGNKL